jgi:hypothetical protein
MILIFRSNLAPLPEAMQLWIYTIEHLLTVAVQSTAWSNRIGVLGCSFTAANHHRSPP